jgi:hypothetical protein
MLLVIETALMGSISGAMVAFGLPVPEIESMLLETDGDTEYDRSLLVVPKFP